MASWNVLKLECSNNVAAGSIMTRYEESIGHKQSCDCAYISGVGSSLHVLLLESAGGKPCILGHFRAVLSWGLLSPIYNVLQCLLTALQCIPESLFHAYWWCLSFQVVLFIAEFGGAARIMAGLLSFDICLCCPAEKKSPHMQAFNWDNPFLQ